jgi:hypothetical protein
MLLALTVFFLVAIAFWRSVIQFLVALLFALLVLGGLELAHVVGSLTAAGP